MTSNPCARSSSLMQSGGLVWMELFDTIVYTPCSRRYLPTSVISALVALKLVIGVYGSWLRTRSRMPNSPRLRYAPTLGCFAASRSWCARITESIAAARSTRWSSSYTFKVASEAAREMGWLE